MSKKGKKARFRALQRIWHSAQMCYCEPGDEVDLSHLSNEEIQRLVNDKIVQEVEDVHDEELQS